MAVYDNVEHRKKIIGHEVDIYLPDFDVAIEYDGNYWHQTKHKADVKKQTELLKSGVRLLRVRELPLPKIGMTDILIDGRHNFAKKTVDALVDLIGLYNERVTYYLTKNEFANDDLYVEYISYFPSPLPEKSLAHLAPELSKQWHLTKNKQLTPANFTAKSNHTAWWSCDFGHEYRARIAHRFKGSGCPKCAGRVATPETCMEATHPELARLWHPTKNEKFTPKNVKAGSGINAWWKCPQGHEWVASPANMKKPDRRSHCAECKTVEIPSRIANSMAELRPDMAAAFHPTKNGDFTPHNLTAGTSRMLWWQCSQDKSHVWQTSGSNHKRSHRPDLCPDCRRKLK